MAAIVKLRNSAEHKYFISALVASSKAGEALENITKLKLQNVHQQLLQNIGQQPVCQQQCSQQYRDLNRWCNTCTAWKVGLVGYHTSYNTKQRTIKWAELQSWEWPNNPNNIAEVFMLPGWDKTNPNMKDLSVSLNIWNKCSEFSRNVIPFSKALKTSRNELAHVASPEISGHRKTEVFNNIRQVLNHNEVRPHVANLGDMLQTLQELEQGELHKHETDISNALSVVGIETNEILATVRNINTRLSDLYIILRRLAILVLVFLFPIIVGICFPNMTTWLRNFMPVMLEKDVQRNSSTLTSQDGCLPESVNTFQTTYPSLIDYLSHHKTLVGRQWLYEQVEEHIDSHLDNHSGILLEAEMGYGKSAFIASIVCAKEHDRGASIRKRLLAYHLCKFDVKVTQLPSVFILRLASMIANQFPLFMKELVADRNCLDYYDHEYHCESDVNGCMDRCLMFPLQRLTVMKSQVFIILIDALDECRHGFTQENRIFKLLKQRVHKFPAWLKFVVTSRKLADNADLRKDFGVIYLNSTDKRNTEDIHQYLSETNNRHLSSQNFTNFLILQSQLQTFKTGAVTSNLYRFYDQQFDRLFPTDFSTEKLIIETIITTFIKRTEENIWHIFDVASEIDYKQFKIAISKLHHFFTVINDEIHIYHQSVVYWLETESEDKFRINIEFGHAINAKYFVKLLKLEIYNFDINDLAIHLEYTPKHLKTELLKLNISAEQIKFLESNFSENAILRMTRRNDYTSIPALIFEHFEHISQIGKDNLTAPYIAASLGFTHKLVKLVELGGDINYRVPQFREIIHLENAAKIGIEMKHWGYGLLDIASQNGHIETVKYILENNNTLFKYSSVLAENGIHLQPVHLACKFGHILIISEYFKHHKTILDWQCLYFASENDHVEVIRFLTGNGITDHCRPCTTDLHWVNKNDVRIQGQMIVSNESTETYVLFDDWHLLTCETALHVAVRRNHLPIVQILLQANSTLNCFDRGGRPPLITALQYGHREIAMYILKDKKTHDVALRCRNATQITDIGQLHENEQNELESYFCQTGLNIETVIANNHKYWEVADLKISNDNEVVFEFDWTVRDQSGCHQAHAAACSGNTELLAYFVLKQEDLLNLECDNGSSPMSSAIQCGALKSVAFLVSNTERFTEYCQARNYAYVWEAAMVSDNSETVSHMNSNLSKIIETLISVCKFNISLSNEFNRNILHYIIRNGHLHMLTHMLSKQRHSSMYLLQQKDLHDQCPIQYALRQLHTKKYVYIYFNRSFFPLSNEIEHILQCPREYTLSLTMRFMKRIGILQEPISKQLLKGFIRKFNFNLVRLYIKHVVGEALLYDVSIAKIFFQTDSHGFALFQYFTAFEVFSATHKEKGTFSMSSIVSCSTCKEVKSQCNLHTLALHFNKLTSCFLLSKDILSNISRSFAIFLFHSSPPDVLNACYDSDGFNVMERAIQGHSKVLTSVLMDRGVKSSLSADLQIRMALEPLKYRTDSDIITLVSEKEIDSLNVIKMSFYTFTDIIRTINDSSREGYSEASTLIESLMMHNETLIDKIWAYENNVSDVFVSFIISKLVQNISTEFVCNNKSCKFSLIHLLSIQGFTSSLQTCVKYFGHSVLQCRNYDNFTSFYLSNVFDAKSTSKYILRSISEFEYPHRIAEKHLLFKLATRMHFTTEKRTLCLLKYFRGNSFFDVTKVHMRGVIKAYRCFKLSKSGYGSLFDTSMISSSQFAREYRWAVSFLSNLKLSLSVAGEIRLHNQMVNTLEKSAILDTNRLLRKFNSLTNLLTKIYARIGKLTKEKLEIQLDNILTGSCKCTNTIQKGEMIKQLREMLLRLEHLTPLEIFHETDKACELASSNNYMHAVYKRLFKFTQKNLFNQAVLDKFYMSGFLCRRMEKFSTYDWYFYHHQYRYSYMDVVQHFPIYKSSLILKFSDINSFQQLWQHLIHAHTFIRLEKDAKDLAKEFQEKNPGN